jgi:hypothetical protein
MIRARFIVPFLALTLVLSMPSFAHAQVACNVSNDNCATGVCIQTSNAAPGVGTCVTTGLTADQSGLAQGQQCTSDSQCGDNLACLPEGSPGTCQPDPSVSSVNGSTTPAAASPASFSGANISATSDTLDYVMTRLMSLFAWLLGIAAITLDNAMYYTVVHMGSYVNGLSAVGVAWRILRDIGNIILLFGFIALGITVILDVDWYGGGTKMLPTLIIAAIFLNFSLFVAEAVIDVGNLFATEFYTQINGGSPAAPNLGYSGITTNGISTAVMNQLGLQTIYQAAAANQTTQTGASSVNATTNNLNIFKAGNPFIVGFMAILLFMIAAFVFFSLAFLLIARFIFLIFLIIIAPIGFAGLAVPKLDGAAKMWWGQLFEQTLTAPVMLLMLYVALAVITDSQFLTGFTASSATGSAASTAAQSSWTTWLTTGQAGIGGLASILLSFFVAMGLLLAVTMLAKRMGAIGGATAMKWGTRLSGLSVAAATVGWTGRQTVGALGNATAKGLRNTGFGRSFVGRGIANSIEKNVAKASFDVRNTDLAKSGGGKVGLDLGQGQKGGYQKDLADRMEAYKQAGLSFKNREQTQEEKDAIATAAANTALATEQRDEARNKRDAIAQENKQHNDNLALYKEEQEKDPQWMANLNNYKKLQVAKAGKESTETALVDANKNLAAAEEKRKTTINVETTIRTNIEEPIKAATKKSQEDYAKRLEGWGLIPIVGGPFRDAAKVVRKNIGKSKEDVENETTLKKLKKLLDKEEKVETAKEEKKEEPH